MSLTIVLSFIRRGIPGSIITNFRNYAFWDLFSVNFRSNFAGLTVTSVKTKQTIYKDAIKFNGFYTMNSQKKTHHSKVLNSKLETCWKCQMVFIPRQAKLPQSNRMGSEETVFTEDLCALIKAHHLTLSLYSAPAGHSSLIHKTWGGTKVISEILSNPNILQSWLNTSN